VEEDKRRLLKKQKQLMDVDQGGRDEWEVRLEFT